MRRALALSALLLLLVARPAQTVGVEAWHDSAVPQSAFTAVLPPQAAHASQGSATRPTAAREFRGQPPAAETSNAAGRLAPLPSLAPASRPSLGVAASVTGELSGVASWYRYVAGQAAAGPALRVGDWRGRRVTVTANGRSVVVALTDACQCYGTRLIDLDRRTFAVLAPLAAGLVDVEVTW